MKVPRRHVQGGLDIALGTYKSTGNDDDLCYWERAKDATHDVDSIVANDNVSGTAIVKISASDADFNTTGGKDWVKTGLHQPPLPRPAPVHRPARH